MLILFDPENVLHLKNNKCFGTGKVQFLVVSISVR